MLIAELRRIGMNAQQQARAVSNLRKRLANLDAEGKRVRALRGRLPECHAGHALRRAAMNVGFARRDLRVALALIECADLRNGE